jgi:hypothetical protein
MPPEGFDATVARYVEGLAPYGWKRALSGPVSSGHAVLQKRSGLNRCRQLWLTRGGRFASKGTDLATVPERLNVELRPRTPCYPLEETT